jgi:hypothetical protein
MKKFPSLNLLNFGVIAATAPHLLCCVLPIVLAGLSLVAPANDAAALHLIPDEWMPWLLGLSGVMLAGSYYLVWRRHCDCKCGACNVHGHKTQKVILIMATMLFIISAGIHFLNH